MIKKSRLRTQKPKKGRRGILFLLIFAVLGAVGYQLEQYYGITTSLKEMVHTIKTTFSPDGPVRGAFYDRNLKQLAVTLDRVSVYARTREIDSIKDTADQLGQVLALDKEKLEDQLKTGVLRLWIARDINQEQEISIKKLQLPGVYLQRDEKRYYPNNSQAAHIVGYVEDGIGLAGVEFFYDRLLAGVKPTQLEDRQALSNSLDFVLALDLKIQDILEKLVRDIALGEQAEKVAVYLMEIGTGEIIGGANLPGFNPNTFAKYSQEQIENMFVVPVCLPEKFRIFLRDATLLHARGEDDLSPGAWSLVPENNDLGSQLRLWDKLGLEEISETDFYVPTESEKTTGGQQRPVVASKTSFSFVPEVATPLNLLTTCSVLLGKGKKIHPFVVKKILDKESGAEIPLSGNEDSAGKSDMWSDAAGERMRFFFRSQARQGEAGAYFFRDDILVSVESGGQRQFLVNDLLFVTIPAGTHNLSMLLVVQRPPVGVNHQESDGKKNFEQLVEEKVERISILQQIANSVADVVEPEIGEVDNYQGKNRLASQLSGRVKTIEKEQAPPGVMPDLKGLSLRKSLRLLQGLSIELHIQGTGRVIDQKPRPGTSFKGITECILILEKQENIAPEKLSQRLPGKD